MRKAYQELFDEVHASERLRTEVMNMKNTESTDMRPKRRIPAAALIAAVLVVVLAGTALAGEYLGRFRIEWLSGFQTPGGEIDGYSVTLEDVRFPAEELSDAVFTIGEEIGDVHQPHRQIAFDSWTECEEFLGVELADNPRLAELQKSTCSFGRDRAHVWLALYYAPMLPTSIHADAYYRQGNEITVSQGVSIRTQYDIWGPEDRDYLVPQNGEDTLEYEAYTMSNGTEALLFTDTYETTDRGKPFSDFDCCYASFIMNDMRYLLNVSVRSNPGEVPEVGALALAKEILDAYE